MRSKSKIVWKSLVYAVCLLAVLAGLGSIPHLQIFAFLWLPGALLAALVFPQGIESDFGFTYMALAGLLDLIIYFVPIYLLLLSREKKELDLQQGRAEDLTTYQPNPPA